MLSQVSYCKPVVHVGRSRFLETDPVQGGSANDYDYVNGDPANGLDLDGTMGGGPCTGPVANFFRTARYGARFRCGGHTWVKTRPKKGFTPAAVGHAVVRVAAKAGRVAACVGGEVVWPPNAGSAALEAGSSISGGGVIALGYGGAAATATGVGAVAVGAGFVAYGSYKIYQACSDA